MPPPNSSAMRANCSTCAGSQQAARDLAAHHLHARLPLPVDAVLEPERAELVLGDFAGEEGLGLLAEDFDLLADGAVVLVVELRVHNLVLLDRDYHIHVKSAIDIQTYILICLDICGLPYASMTLSWTRRAGRRNAAAKPLPRSSRKVCAWSWPTRSRHRRRPKVAIPVFRGGKGLQPGVDLNNSADLLDIMEGLK